MTLRATATPTPSERTPSLGSCAGALLSALLVALGPARARASEPADALHTEMTAPPGSPRAAGRSLEARRAPVADAVLELATVELPRTPPSSLAVQLRLGRVEGWLEGQQKLRDQLMPPLGVVLLGFGLSGLGTSLGLGALDGQPTPTPSCPPGPTGPCVKVYANMDTAATLGLIAATATISGAIVSALDEPGERRVGVLVGPTRVGVGFEF